MHVKVLIVDDNVAVQEIIRDILVEEGYDVHVASGTEEAVQKIESFQPDIILLDSWVGDGDGIRVITRYHEEHEDEDLNVVLIKSSSEQVPKDNPFIKGHIDKPFKSTDVIAVMRDTIDIIAAEQATVSKKKRKHKVEEKRGLFRKKRDRIPEPETDLEEEGVDFGSSYIIFESGSDGVYNFIGLFQPSVYDILIVSSDKEKAVRERFSYGDMDIISMSTTQKSRSMDIHGLGSLLVEINKFVDGHDKPVVAIDNLRDMVEADGLNYVLVFLHQMIGGRSKPCTFVASIDLEMLTDKDRNIILHDMRQYKSK